MPTRLGQTGPSGSQVMKRCPGQIRRRLCLVCTRPSARAAGIGKRWRSDGRGYQWFRLDSPRRRMSIYRTGLTTPAAGDSHCRQPYRRERHRYVGVNADVYMSSWYNAAWVDGAGTLRWGVTIGNIDAAVWRKRRLLLRGIQLGISRQRCSATGGDITVGTVTLRRGSGRLHVMNSYAGTTRRADSGDATVGNITIGDITMSVGDNAASKVVDVEASNWAEADRSTVMPRPAISPSATSTW